MNISPKTGSIKIKVLRPDWDDISEFEITATINNWQASLKFWGYADTFKDFGNQLQSFPDDAKDAVTFELGAELSGKKREWDSHLLLSAYCYDEVGHTAIRIVMNNNLQNPELQNAQFNIFSEPQQINELGKLLSEWDPTKENHLLWETKI